MVPAREAFGPSGSRRPALPTLARLPLFPQEGLIGGPHSFSGRANNPTSRRITKREFLPVTVTDQSGEEVLFINALAPLLSEARQFYELALERPGYRAGPAHLAPARQALPHFLAVSVL